MELLESLEGMSFFLFYALGMQALFIFCSSSTQAFVLAHGLVVATPFKFEWKAGFYA